MMDERHGFIHEKLDIKILILFILRRLPGSVDREVLAELVQSDGGVGYFDFTDCLSELVEAGQVCEDEDGFRITEKGAENGETVESSIPFSARKKAEKLLVPEAERLKRLAMLTAEHTVEDGQNFITLAMNDGMGEIMRMKLLCSSEDQAKRMRRYYKKNAEKVYLSMIEMLDK